MSTFMSINVDVDIGDDFDVHVGDDDFDVTVYDDNVDVHDVDVDVHMSISMLMVMSVLTTIWM